ncbi:DUF1289 domain-containing protein [Rhodovibrionaceae bacterium A322]
MSDLSDEERSERRRRRREARRAQIDNTIPSPCISVCQMDTNRDYCIGCYRTIPEIRDWMIMSKEQKESVLTAAQDRRAGV